METQELVTLVPWTFIFQILNLFIQAWLIKKFLFQPVNRILTQRQAKADEAIEAAKKARADADSEKEAYEKKLSEAKTAASRILAEADDAAEKIGVAIVAEARKESEALVERTKLELEREKAKAREELRQETGQLAMEIAQRVVEREINPSDHARLVDEMIAHIGEER